MLSCWAFRRDMSVPTSGLMEFGDLLHRPRVRPVGSLRRSMCRGLLMTLCAVALRARVPDKGALCSAADV